MCALDLKSDILDYSHDFTEMQSLLEHDAQRTFKNNKGMVLDNRAPEQIKACIQALHEKEKEIQQRDTVDRANAENKVKTVTGEITKTKKIRADLQDDIDDIETNEIKPLVQEIQDIETKKIKPIEKMITDIDKEAELENIRNEIADIDATQIPNLQTDIQDIETKEIDPLRKNLTEIDKETEITSARDKIFAIEKNEKPTLRDEISVLDANIADYRSELTKLEDHAEDKQTVMDVVDDEIQDLLREKGMEKTHAERKKIEGEIQAKKNERAKYQKEKGELIKKMRAQKNLIDNAKRKQEQYRRELKSLAEKVDKIRQSILTISDAKKREYTSAIEHQQNKQDKLKEEVRRLQDKKRTLRKEMSDIKRNKIQVYRNDIAAHEREQDKLKQKIKDWKDKQHALIQQIRDLDSKLFDLDMQRVELEGAKKLERGKYSNISKKAALLKKIQEQKKGYNEMLRMGSSLKFEPKEIDKTIYGLTDGDQTIKTAEDFFDGSPWGKTKFSLDNIKPKKFLDAKKHIDKKTGVVTIPEVNDSWIKNLFGGQEVPEEISFDVVAEVPFSGGGKTLVTKSYTIKLHKQTEEQLDNEQKKNEEKEVKSSSQESSTNRPRWRRNTSRAAHALVGTLAATQGLGVLGAITLASAGHATLTGLGKGIQDAYEKSNGWTFLPRLFRDVPKSVISKLVNNTARGARGLAKGTAKGVWTGASVKDNVRKYFATSFGGIEKYKSSPST